VLRRQRDPVEARGEPEDRDRRVEVEAGREREAQGASERDAQIHSRLLRGSALAARLRGGQQPLHFRPYRLYQLVAAVVTQAAGLDRRPPPPPPRRPAGGTGALSA